MKKLFLILSLLLAVTLADSCGERQKTVAIIDGMDLIGDWAVTEDSRYELPSVVRAYWSFTDQGNAYYYESQSPVGATFSNGVLNTGGNKSDCIFAFGFDVSGHDLNVLSGYDAQKYATITVLSQNAFIIAVPGQNGYQSTCERLTSFK